jgi:hypothetical protein
MRNFLLRFYSQAIILLFWYWRKIDIAVIRANNWRAQEQEQKQNQQESGYEKK